MGWGQWGKQLSKSAMERLIKECLSLGITTFDHADIYGGYTTEAEFGKAFSQSGIKREQIQLISKCGIQYLSENRNNTIKHYDYSSDYIIWSVEQSLHHLQTEYLDVLLLHRPSPLMQADDIAEAITKLKSEGKIKHFGISNFTPIQTELIAKAIPIDINQIECSLTHYQPMLDGSLDHMTLHNITPMAWSPLGQVFKTDNEQTQRIHSILEELSETYNATKNQLLLAWLMKHPSGIIPVVGTTDHKRLANAMKASVIDLSTEDWFKLLVASQGHKAP